MFSFSHKKIVAIIFFVISFFIFSAKSVLANYCSCTGMGYKWNPTPQMCESSAFYGSNAICGKIFSSETTCSSAATKLESQYSCTNPNNGEVTPAGFYCEGPKTGNPSSSLCGGGIVDFNNPLPPIHTWTPQTPSPTPTTQPAKPLPFTVPKLAFPIPGLHLTTELSKIGQGECLECSNSTVTDPADCDREECLSWSSYSFPWIGEYLIALYKWTVSALALAAVLMIVVGGIGMIFAGGDSTRIGESKKRIYSAAIGLVFLLIVYQVLALIDPNLLIFKNLTLVGIKGEHLTAESTTSVCFPLASGSFKNFGTDLSITRVGAKRTTPSPHCHSGQDIFYTSTSADVVSVGRGEVLQVYDFQYQGTWAVMVYYEGLNQTVNYGELIKSSITVKPGATVEPYQKLGQVGSADKGGSGMLHFELFQGKLVIGERSKITGNWKDTSNCKGTWPKKVIDPYNWLNSLPKGGCINVPGGGGKFAGGTGLSGMAGINNLIGVYRKIAGEESIAWTFLAAIHYEEGGNRDTASLLNGCPMNGFCYSPTRTYKNGTGREGCINDIESKDLKCTHFDQKDSDWKEKCCCEYAYCFCNPQSGDRCGNLCKDYPGIEGDIKCLIKSLRNKAKQRIPGYKRGPFQFPADNNISYALNSDGSPNLDGGLANIAYLFNGIEYDPINDTFKKDIEKYEIYKQVGYDPKYGGISVSPYIMNHFIDGKNNQFKNLDPAGTKGKLLKIDGLLRVFILLNNPKNYDDGNVETGKLKSLNPPVF